MHIYFIIRKKIVMHRLGKLNMVDTHITLYSHTESRIEFKFNFIFDSKRRKLERPY